MSDEPTTDASAGDDPHWLGVTGSHLPAGARRARALCGAHRTRGRWR
ncbi:hypothetical protein [Halegenticoccus soli]|nr:hypothetical protein [Halegenticoccus soli]